MYKSGDILAAKLPMGCYGAIRIICAGAWEGVPPQPDTGAHTDDEIYLIAVTRYFDAAPPQLGDPRLLQAANIRNTSTRHIHIYGGYKHSGKILKRFFRHIGNIPPTDAERALRLRIPTPGDKAGFSARALDDHFPLEIFNTLASYSMIAAHDKEVEIGTKHAVYRLRSADADKFWCITWCDVNNFLSRHGGNTGKRADAFRHKYFPTLRERDREMQKRIAERIKEGYEPADEYFVDDEGRYWFDREMQQARAAAAPAPKAAALRYRNEKSDKFWRIEYAERVYVVNYGKVGTVGKYRLRECDTAAACEKKAASLIASKMKKGYAPYADFDPAAHFYVDDRDSDAVHHPLTSHPAYRAHFTHERYYCVADDFAPFGNDEGADLIGFLEDDLCAAYKKERGNVDATLHHYPKQYMEADGSMTYIPPDDPSPEATQALLRSDNAEMNMHASDEVTIAAAFGQIKITGKIDPVLKQMAINAIKRQIVGSQAYKTYSGGEWGIDTYREMLRDLEGFGRPG